MGEVDPLLFATRLLDYTSPDVTRLILRRGWQGLSRNERIGAAYEFVRNEIAFGYNHADDIPSSRVLADGYGQCNTKGTLLMALLRGLGIRCRLHGFTIHKELQRGIVPESVFRLAPREILHSWVEVETQSGWISLEGFILNAPFLAALQRAFSASDELCGFGVGTTSLSAPPVAWTGKDTYIQRTGIIRDLGTYHRPDEFYANHRQELGVLRTWLYRHVIRHRMNQRVRAIRRGKMPGIIGAALPNHRHEEPHHAA